MIPVNIINGGIGECAENAVCAFLPPAVPGASSYMPLILMGILSLILLGGGGLMTYVIYRRIRKTFMIMIVLFCITTVSAQVSEITQQNVKINDMVRQYAVIQFVNPAGSPYFDYCTDCVCSASVYGENLILRKDDIAAAEIESGLFGFRATTNLFTTGKNHLVRFNCTSTEYGSGEVDSQVYILSGDTPASTAVDGFGTENVFIYDWINDLLNPPEDEVEDSPSVFDGVLGLITGALDGILKIMAIAFKLITSPAEGLQDLMGLFIGIFWGLILLLMPFIMLLECFAIVYSLKTYQGGNIISLVMVVVNANILIFSWGFMVLRGIIEQIIDLGNLIIGLISTIRQQFQV